MLFWSLLTEWRRNFKICINFNLGTTWMIIAINISLLLLIIMFYFTSWLQFPFPALLLVHPSQVLSFPTHNLLLLYFSLERGKSPMSINKPWSIKLSKNKHFPTSKDCTRRPVWGVGSQKAIKRAPVPTVRSLMKEQNCTTITYMQSD